MVQYTSDFGLEACDRSAAAVAVLAAVNVWGGVKVEGVATLGVDVGATFKAVDALFYF